MRESKPSPEVIQRRQEAELKLQEVEARVQQIKDNFAKANTVAGLKAIIKDLAEHIGIAL